MFKTTTKSLSKSLSKEKKERDVLMYLAQQILNNELVEAIKAVNPPLPVLKEMVYSHREAKIAGDYQGIVFYKTSAPKTFALAYGAIDPTLPLLPMKIPRRALGPTDVRVKILFSGVCHSDLHHVKNDWKDSHYPLVPGHEIIGVVEEIGEGVKSVDIGDFVAVGNMTDSCRVCKNCFQGKEQYCENAGPTWTYNSHERVHAFKDEKGVESCYHSLFPDGMQTFGGYSTLVVANEDFVFSLPKKLAASPSTLAAATPLLCAGITMYAPLKEFDIGPGHLVGIAGIGGLGHLGVKIASALGATVVALTTTPWKIADAVENLGADDAILISDPHERQRYKNKLDLIIDTIPYSHQIDPYVEMLKLDTGKLHIVGDMNKIENSHGWQLVFFGKNITTSNVGGLPITREMLDFCAEHDIVADIEIIPIQKINQAMEMLADNQVRYRFVIDTSSFKN